MTEERFNAYMGRHTEGLEEDVKRMTIWLMRCHSCKDDYEANRGEWTCPGCGSDCTELLETIERRV
jgi:rRNA maturation endonuclease Nob1